MHIEFFRLMPHRAKKRQKKEQVTAASFHKFSVRANLAHGAEVIKNKHLVQEPVARPLQ